MAGTQLSKYGYSFSSRFHALTAVLRYSQCVGTARPFCLGTYRTKKTKTVGMGQHIPAAVEFKTGVKQQSLSHHRRRRSWGQEGREVLMRVRVLVLVVVLMELERHRRDARLVLRRPARWALRGARRCWASWSGAARRVIFSPGDAASALTLCWNNEAVISGRQRENKLKNIKFCLHWRSSSEIQTMLKRDVWR